MINEAKQAQGTSHALMVDLHPDRPAYRGIAPPSMPEHIISLQADPTFEEITNAGGVVDKQSQAHTVLDDMFLISGEIPRVTAYENGLQHAVRFDPEENDWFSDERITDERFLACNLKGNAPRYSVDALAHSPREGTRRLHRLWPRRRSQHSRTCLQTRGWSNTFVRSGWRLSPRHERRISDPEHSR